VEVSLWLSTVGCLVTLALGLLLAPLTAEAQPPPKVPRIGVLSAFSFTDMSRYRAPFRQALHELGYVEGQTIVLEERWAEGQLERLPDLAAELLRLQVNIIVAGEVPAARAARQVTERLPIVVTSGDAVGTGLITNIARPGGNLTGLATNSAELSGKWLDLLKEAVPTLSRVAVLSEPTMPITGVTLHEMQAVVPALGIQLQSLSVREVGGFEGAFAAMRREHAEALVVLPSTIAAMHRAQINALAARSRLPTMWWWRDAVVDGGLMAYAADEASMWRRAATYVDKILKGATPGNLPVERPMKYELVINLKTAYGLGLTLPPTLLLQADEVLQ
jgi:putative ABC transport system substrate-binding protein